jgi:branched-chain amino acid transport system substrate-binding protein
MKLHKVSALAAVSILAFAACSSSTGSSAPSAGASTGAGASGGASAVASKGELKLGVTLPLSGGAAADGQPTLKGAQLAVDAANAAGGVSGYTIKLVPLDHAVNGKYNEQQGAQDMQTFVADSKVIGVVGPYNSAVAKVQIPISNAAGLLQCSPANTNETLTKPPAALDFRKTNPDKINYIRVAATDDIQGPAMAIYAFNTLGLKNLLVVDDVTTFGKGVADNFQKKYEELGGKVVLRQGAPADTTDFNGIISSQALTATPPDGVYYGGVVTSGGGLFLKQLRQAGLAVPFMGPDGIVNGSGSDKGSLIQIAGADAAKNSYGTVAAIGDFPGKKDFDAAYTEHFKADADFKTPGAYSGPANACAVVILKSLEAALAAGATDDAAIREGVRKYASDPANKFETVLGTESFDVNGDTTQPYISFYVTDPAAKAGVGDWVFKEQQSFASK